MLETGIFPRCPNCEKGVLLPFQDTTRGNELTVWKAWACSTCETEIVYKDGKFIKIDANDKWK